MWNVFQVPLVDIGSSSDKFSSFPSHLEYTGRYDRQCMCCADGEALDTFMVFLLLGSLCPVRALQFYFSFSSPLIFLNVVPPPHSAPSGNASDLLLTDDLLGRPNLRGGVIGRKARRYKSEGRGFDSRGSY